jgi:UDP-N-acetylenolpyruvoylglucosamine reductase
MVRELKPGLSPATVLRENELLSKRTTLRVGGPADLYVEPASEEDLAFVLRFCKSRGVPWMMLGRGSNLLVRDGGIRGMVICLAGAEFNQLGIDGTRVRSGAGVRLRTLAFEAKKALITGFEFMEGIPGNVGGALRMNAGAMGSAMFEVLSTVRYMDSTGEIHQKTVDQVPVEYRNCPLFKTHIVLSAEFAGSPGSKEQIDQKMNECSQKRWKSQPAAPSGRFRYGREERPRARWPRWGTQLQKSMLCPASGNFLPGRTWCSSHCTGRTVRMERCRRNSRG